MCQFVLLRVQLLESLCTRGRFVEIRRKEPALVSGLPFSTVFIRDSDVDKFVEFLSLENKKGQDHFETERFGMFKALFRNFGDSVLGLFRGHIERLVKDHRESTRGRLRS